MVSYIYIDCMREDDDISDILAILTLPFSSDWTGSPTEFSGCMNSIQ